MIAPVTGIANFRKWLQAAVQAHDRDGLLDPQQLPSWALSKNLGFFDRS
jgi:hypothetical protein